MSTAVGARRRGLLVVLCVVVAAGLASRRWPHAQPAVVAAYAGDVLWSVMVYVLLALAWPRAAPRTLAGVALAVAWSVELSQLVHTSWLDAMRSTRAGALALGQGFLWSDLACYALGIALAWLVDRRVSGPTRRG